MPGFFSPEEPCGAGIPGQATVCPGLSRKSDPTTPLCPSYHIPMFRIEKTGTSRLEITMSGRLDEDSMRRALDEIAAKTADIEKGTMLYDVVDFHLPTLGAIRIEFARLPSMLGLMKRFDRAAVLTDKSWLQRVSEIEGWFFPNLEIKAFERTEREKAEAWLSEERTSKGN
jgi:hypothetical protein